MATFNFVEYMHSIAVSLKDIGHVDNDPSKMRFFRVESLAVMDEALQNMDKFNGTGLMVEDNEEGDYQLGGGNMMFDNANCGFWIIRKPLILDANSRSTELKAAKLIMRKIISKIRRDYRSDNDGKTDIGLRDIDFNSLRYFTFGPVNDGCYGIYCNFVVKNPDNYPYTADDWNA